MKDAEDEAFDELAKRQGHWGGGYQAKKAMAADKMQEPPSEWAGIKAILDEYGLQAIDFVADFKAALAQPAQEPVALRRGDILRCIETNELCTVWATSTTGKTLIKWSANNFGSYTAEQIGELFWLEPAQEPVARVSGTYGGRFVYDPINRAAILPVGMALYAMPPQPAREWNFCERCGKRTNDIHTCTPPQGDA
jgi:hypothetical protein